MSSKAAAQISSPEFIGSTSVVPASERTLPVSEVFEGLLPGDALQRGWAVRATGSAALLVSLALSSEVTRLGNWLAIVGFPTLNVRVLEEVGVRESRALSVEAGPSEWSKVVATLIEAVDIVIFASPAALSHGESRALGARARKRGVVLFEVATRGSTLSHDIEVDASPVEWDGLGEGYGAIRSRVLSIEVGGRRARGSRSARLALPSGCVGTPAGSAGGGWVGSGHA